MAVGLVIGIGSDPTPMEFEELLDRGLIHGTDFQYVTLELTPEEAANRTGLRELYRSACVKQGWMEGMAYADALAFAEVSVGGTRMVIVQPEAFGLPVAEPEPEAAHGGIIAGVGYTPTQQELQGADPRLDLHPGWQYVIEQLSPGDAASEDFLVAHYASVAHRQGWQREAGGLSVQRRTVGGRQLLLIQPSDAA